MSVAVVNGRVVVAAVVVVVVGTVAADDATMPMFLLCYPRI